MKELHLICNSHIDPVWQWDWEEGMGVTISTFKQAADFCEEYNYIFCHNESLLYEYVEKNDPELFSRIKKLVDEGKWVIAGGWYLQPDCDMPSGEAMVRQIKLGREYFAAKFGKRPTVAYNFDSFGHSVGLPQILKKCGFDGYIICRPMPMYYPLPENEFLWEGVDGSIVTVARANDEGIYTSGYGTALAEIKRKMGHYADSEYGLALWGVGNHGGVNSKKDLEDIKAFRMNSTDVKVIHSTPERYLSCVNPKTVVKESLPILRGSYSSMSSIKQINSLLESKLFATEKLCAYAESEGLYEKNEEVFTQAEKALAEIEFHDCLSGTIVKSGETTSLLKGQRALMELQEEREKAFLAMIKHNQTAELDTFPFFVWNEMPYAREAVIETEVLIPKALVSDSEEYAPVAYYGNEHISCQVIAEEGNINMDRRKRIAYRLSMRPFSIERVDVRFDVKPKTKFIDDGKDIVYADKCKSLRISRQTGLLESYRVEGRELLSNGAFLPVMYDDNADPWGWDLAKIGSNPKDFSLSKGEKGPFEGRPAVRVVEDGEVLTEVESLFECEASFVKVGYKIYRGLPYIDVSYYVLWNEQEKTLKIKIPTSISGDFFGQIMFGEETFHADGTEYVAQRFIGKKDGQKALCLYNKGVYSFAAEGGTLFATLLRGAAYCAHPIEKRPILWRDRFVPYIEQGKHEFSFRFGYSELNELENNAQEFVDDIPSLNFFPHGEGKEFINGVSIDNKGISLSALYREHDQYYFRLFNNNETPQETSFQLFGVKAKASFGKFEVKTFVWKDGTITEIDLWC